MIDRFLGSLEAPSWLTALAYPKSKVDMTLVAEFYHSMDWSILTCVLDLVDGRQFRISDSDFPKFLYLSNEGDVAYFKNVTSDVLF